MEFGMSDYGQEAENDVVEKKPNFFQNLKEQRKKRHDLQESKSDDKPKSEEKEDRKLESKKEKINKEQPKNDLDAEREIKKQELAKDYVASRKIELNDQLASLKPDNLDYPALKADLMMLDALEQKLSDPDLEVDPAVEEAYQQMLQELDNLLNPPGEMPEEESDTLVVEPTAEDLPIPNEFSDYASDQNSQLPTDSTSTPRQSHTSIAIPTTNGGFYNPTTAQNSLTNTNAESTKSHPEVRPKFSRQLIASGAITAFVMGRNRSENLDKQTREIRTNMTPIENPGRVIAEREQEIRRIIRQQTEARSPETRTFERPPNAHDGLPLPTGTNAEVSDVQRQTRPEAFVLQPITSEISQPQIDQPKQKVKMPKLEQLTTPELLQIAASIKVDGQKVSQLYETNQIDHKGLVALIKESLKNGNLKKVLNKHHLGYEAKLGRKIEMRHDNSSDLSDESHTLSQPSPAVQLVIDKLKKKSQGERQPENKPLNSVDDIKKIPTTKKQLNILPLSITTAAGIAIGTALAIIFG